MRFRAHLLAIRVQIEAQGQDSRIKPRFIFPRNSQCDSFGDSETPVHSVYFWPSFHERPNESRVRGGPSATGGGPGYTETRNPMIIDNSAFEVLLKGAFLCRNAHLSPKKLIVVNANINNSFMCGHISSSSFTSGMF